MYFLIALIPAFLYGSMGIVMMKLGGDSRQQTMGVAGGSLTFAIILAMFLGVDTDPTKMLVAFAAGVSVGLATFFQLRGFHKIGVSGVMPITTGGQLLGISLLGILLFGEWLGTSALPVGLVGLAMVTSGALLTSWTEPDATGDVEAVPYVPVAIEDGPAHAASARGASAHAASARGAPAQTAGPRISKDQRISGVVDTLISTAFYIAFPIIIRWWDVDPLRSFLPQSIGLLLAGFIATFPIFTKALGAKDTRWSKYSLYAFIPGMMWAAGAVIMQFSQIKVGVAVGFSFSQLSIIIATFGGILILGETRTKKEMRLVAIGVALLVIGALVLGYAKTLDVPV